jgi:hypothetical protein
MGLIERTLTKRKPPAKVAFLLEERSNLEKLSAAPTVIKR